MIAIDLHKAETGESIHCSDGNCWDDISELIEQDDLVQLMHLNAYDIELYRFVKEHIAAADGKKTHPLASAIENGEGSSLELANQ